MLLQLAPARVNSAVRKHRRAPAIPLTLGDAWGTRLREFKNCAGVERRAFNLCELHFHLFRILR